MYRKNLCIKELFKMHEMVFNPLTDMPILDSSSSTANNDMMSKM